MKQNVLLEKTFEFAVKSVKLARIIQEKHREYIISRQFLKAATSIGANSEEAVAGHSTADFVAKLTIAQKEARETKYWLRLIQASEMHDCTEHLTSLEEILRILASIILTTKQRGEKTAKPIHNS